MENLKIRWKLRLQYQATLYQLFCTWKEQPQCRSRQLILLLLQQRG